MREINLRLSDDEAKYVLVLLANQSHAPIAKIIHGRMAAEIGARNRSYTVKAGDTLWSIAEDHYGPGQGGQYPIIFEANQPPLTDPDKIHPGQVLHIPDLPPGSK